MKKPTIWVGNMFGSSSKSSLLAKLVFSHLLVAAIAGALLMLAVGVNYQLTSRTTNLGVIAEGIETQSQLELLKEIGCTHGQGKLSSMPLTAEEIEDRFNTVQAMEVPWPTKQV